MSVAYQPLVYTPGVSWAALREMRGCDEQAIEGANTTSAIVLLDHLLVACPGTDFLPGEAAQLVTADRDWLLATVYARTYGSQVESVIPCCSCKKRFDMSFDLLDLANNLRNQSNEYRNNIDRDKDGNFRKNGFSFRLLTGEDELAISRLPTEEAKQQLLTRCLFSGDADPEKLQSAMEATAPLLNLDLTADCPECGHAQPVHFDMQYYLLATLLGEKPRLVREIHYLALAYGWSLNEILDLPRSERRQFVALIERESTAVKRPL